ncbi:aspartate ammonia-lyase [Rhodococcus sp. IEGM 1318]|uniref:aspartate ammonia-lyase n=1 Tax=Rhodococcus sp. IEGM 1318 TaxID=3082226 RepID=UPI003989F14C
MQIAASAYYGIHTARAIDNFPISGRKLHHYRHLVNSIVEVKRAAATSNLLLGKLSETKARAIVAACDEIRGGALHEHFVVDMVQGGAGTSTNMNANEVIANRALELLGHDRGEYLHLDPIDDVNNGQSTNDVYPTALKLASRRYIDELATAMENLIAAMRDRSRAFEHIRKVGRTQLQDAVPMMLGAEFAAFGVTLHEEFARFDSVNGLLGEINLGGTAIGTGVNSHPEYSRTVAGHLSELTGYRFAPAADLIEATQDVGVFVLVSATLKRCAIKLSKICNDLRLLSSGPQHGLSEIRLPPVQAGSSIMPGKVNPVIPEMVNQVAYEIMGRDVTVSMAAEAGQLQLNAFEPVIAFSIFDSFEHLTAAMSVLAERCIRGIEANESALAEQMERSITVVTGLTPWIGYKRAAAIAVEALESGRRIEDIVRTRGFMSEAQLSQALGGTNSDATPNQVVAL